MQQKTELTQDIRFGLYPSRDGEDGEKKKTVMKVDISIRTNDTKEQVLFTVDEAYKRMIEFVNENFNAFVVPGCELP